MKENLNKILKMVELLETSSDEVQNQKTIKDLKEYINGTLEQLDFKEPDLNLMSLQELEELICNGMYTPSLLNQIQSDFYNYSSAQQKTMESAYSLLKDVDFRLSEDEDEETVEERMEKIDEAMNDFASDNNLNFEDGEFWEPSGC